MAKKQSKNKSKDTYDQIANFVYETGIHSKTPRSGFWFLGSGEQSVAEHLFHTAMIAYTLAYLEPKADKNKLILMALVHDIGEGRTSDHNYVHQRYGRLAEGQAVKDISESVPFGNEMLELFKEEQERLTLEAKLVKDADILEWIVTLRGEEVKGTKIGKKLGKLLIKTNPDSWWRGGSDAWFIDRKERDKKWDSKKKK